MPTVISLLTAFGLGSIATAIVQAWLSRLTQLDERGFKEKQAAYVGLLEAYHRAAVEGTDEASKYFAYWQMRCELVAPRAVRDAICRIAETNDNRPARAQADLDLRAAMRADLKITN